MLKKIIPKTKVTYYTIRIFHITILTGIKRLLSKLWYINVKKVTMVTLVPTRVGLGYTFCLNFQIQNTTIQLKIVCISLDIQDFGPRVIPPALKSLLLRKRTGIDVSRSRPKITKFFARSHS